MENLHGLHLCWHYRTLVLWLFLPLARSSPVKIQVRPFLCGVCVFSSCMYGFHATVQRHAVRLADDSKFNVSVNDRIYTSASDLSSVYSASCPVTGETDFSTLTTLNRIRHLDNGWDGWTTKGLLSSLKVSFSDKQNKNK